MNMRLIGARSLKEVVPGMVDTSLLNAPGPSMTMYEANCKLHINLSYHEPDADGQTSACFL